VTRERSIIPPASSFPSFQTKVPSPPYVSAKPSEYQEGITAGVTPYWKRCVISCIAIPRTDSAGRPSAQTRAVLVAPSASPLAAVNCDSFAAPSQEP